MPIPGGCMQFRTMPLNVDQGLGKTPFLRRSLHADCLRGAGAGGSNPLTPTIFTSHYSL